MSIAPTGERTAALRAMSVAALALVALLLSAGFLWYFRDQPPTTAAPAGEGMVLASATSCHRTAVVRNAGAVTRAFPGLPLREGDELCLVRSDDGAQVLVYELVGESAGAALFTIGGVVSDADLVKIGLTPAA